MTLRLGGDGAITGCTSLEEPTISISGLTMTTPIEAVSGTAAAPSYTFSGDTDNGLYYAGTNSIGLSTAGNNAILIDSVGKVGIGTSSPLTGSRLTVAGFGLAVTGQNTAHSANSIRIGEEGGGAAQIRCYGPDASTNASLTLRVSRSDGSNSQDVLIDSSGRLLVGTSTARANFYNTTASAAFQVEGQGGTGDSRRISVISCDNSATAGGAILLGLQRSGAVGGNTIVQHNDNIGAITFQGNDGAQFVETASIKAQVDGTPGSNDMPGRLVLSTTADGASSPTERMRIDSAGNVGIGGNPTVFTGQNFISIHSPGSSTNIAGIDLHVSGTREAGMISYPSIGESLRIFGNGARSITFHNNSAERMRIDSSGNVGIGITPQRHLHIHQSSSATVGMMLTNGATGAANDSQGFQLKVGSDTHAEVAQMENSNLRFLTNAQERMRILAAGGLTFNGDTAQANALDDYEEGTFTPSIIGTAGASGQSYIATIQGYYVKVGKIVIASFYVELTNKGTLSGTGILVGGFPYVVQGLAGSGSGSIAYFNNLGISVSALQLNARAGTGQAYVNHIPAGGGSAMVNSSTILANTTRLDGVFSYRTS